MVGGGWWVVHDGLLFAAWFEGWDGGEIGGELVRGEGFDVQPEQAEGRDAEVDGTVGTVDDHGDADDGGAVLAGDGDGFLDAAALGDDVFDDQDLFTGGELEAAAEDEVALLLFDEDESDAELAGDLLTDDEAAHGWGDDGGDVEVTDLLGEGGAEAFDGGHVLEREGALEELPAAQAAAEDEVAFEEGTGVAEHVEDFSGRHGAGVKQDGLGWDKAEDAWGVGLRVGGGYGLGMSGGTQRGMRVDQLLSRFGYCSRREAVGWVRRGRVSLGERVVDDVGERVEPGRVQVDGERVEGPEGLLVMVHKPAGVVCSRGEGEGRSVYELLPERWSRRNPAVTTVGRLDRDTTGLLLVTDLGEWVHRWTSPRHHVEKTYEVALDGAGEPGWVDLFASGTLVLDGEVKPCLPARLEWVGDREARLHLTEGRFHQVKRMFAAVGREVVRLHRPRFGPYALEDLPEGAWRSLALPEASNGG